MAWWLSSDQANWWCDITLGFFKILLIYYKRGREGEGEAEKYHCVKDTFISDLSHVPNWVPGLQPWHVPLQGIELATFPPVG